MSCSFRAELLDYLADIADLDTYGSDPLSIEGLRDEFEVFPMLDGEFKGLLSTSSILPRSARTDAIQCHSKT